MTAIKVSMGIILDSEGKILIAQRNLQKNFGGMWEFPGGKQEANESPEQALIRELREELRNKDEKIEILMKQISKKHLIKNIIATRGSEGSILYDFNGYFYYPISNKQKN